ncbi:MAG: hypothetical protein K2Y21_06325 [Phycisphaerales bacterium]|nr:hypothetical protein [Phycisphaerales bacterium]
MSALVRIFAATVASLALAGCNYERLPTSFELARQNDTPGLTVQFAEAMRDPASMKFPPVTVRLLRVDESALRDGGVDLGQAIDAAEQSGAQSFDPLASTRDIALNQRTRRVRLEPGDPLFSSAKVYAAALVPWSDREPPRANYIERVGIFDEQGREISPYVADPALRIGGVERVPPDPNAPAPPRQAALIDAALIRDQGLIIEVDRGGVRVVPSSLRVREVRAIDPAGASSR